jgi:hypothetical protein
MACEGGSGNPLIDAVTGFFEFLGDPIGSIVKGIANLILAGAIAAFGAVTDAVPTFAPAKSDPVNDQVQWLVVYLAVGSLLFACIRMAAERRGEPGQTALKGMVRLILVAGVGTTVMGAMASVGDNYANYLFVGAVNEQIEQMGCGPSSGIEPFLLLVLAFLLLIAAIVHTILLYVRLGVMIVLFGTLPLAAAASMTEWGGGWWRKHLGWMIAWLFYKPTVGLVIYAGSELLSGGEGENAEIHAKIAGICVMLLSAIALPALLKLIVPATAALGGGSAFSTGASAVGGGIASGAKSIGGSASSGAGASGSSGKGGSSGPSGASGSAGSSGQSGPSGMSSGGSGSGGGGGGSGGGGGGGGGSAGGPSGAVKGGGGAGAGGAGAGAGAAAGPAGVIAEAALAAGKAVGNIAKSGIDGNPEDGHNK